MEDASIGLEDKNDPDSELHMPVLVLYPTASRSELIKGVNESDTVGGLVGTVLPVPWEGGAEFEGGDGAGVSVFVETGSQAGVGGLRKVGGKVSWGRVLGGGGCVVLDGICRVFVVPRGRVEGWVREWKVRNGKG